MLEIAFVTSGSEATLYTMHLPGEVRIQVTRASIEKGQFSQTLENNSTDPTAFFQANILGFKLWKQKMERHYLEQIIAAPTGMSSASSICPTCLNPISTP